jgi:Homing endonuclease associated repeat
VAGGRGRAPSHSLVNIDALADICQGVPWPDGLVPAHPEARRLLDTLGVLRLPEQEHPLTSIQELTETRICAQPLCTSDAMKMSRWCRAHAPIRELQAARTQDGGPGGSATRKPDGGDPAAVPAGPGSPNDTVKTGKGISRWTREAMIQAVQAFAAREGRPPRQIDAVGDPRLPNSSTSRQHFGGWADMVEAAGFPRPTRGGPGINKRQVRAPKAPEKLPASPGEDQPTVGAAQPVSQESPGPAVGAASTEVAKQEVALSEPGSSAAVVDADATPQDGDGPETVGERQGRQPGSLSADTEGFSLSLALTGDFARDAYRVRAEAQKLRAQADALDTIAQGIDQLAGTVADG